MTQPLFAPEVAPPQRLDDVAVLLCGFAAELGLPCTFLWGGLHRQDPVRRIAFTHGDALVWGQATRMAYHGATHSRMGGITCLATSAETSRFVWPATCT